MNSQLVRSRLCDGVFFNSISDPKFKHNRIAVNFIVPLERDAACDNAAVPHILRMGCRQLPDLTSLGARLQELYGASLDADVMKAGSYQVLDVSIRGLDNRYTLNGEDVTGACAELLAQIALDPKLDEQGRFEEKDVALQRQYVLDAISAGINDKRSYALSQCVQTMCEGEPVAVRRYGYTEQARAITPESATRAYRNMLRTAPVEILFTGAGDPAGVEAVFRQAFSALERQAGGYPPILPRSEVNGVREKTETMELSQSKLVLGMRCAGLDDERKINAARMFAAMFGGTPFSKLFLNVREKLSLCYYCAARFDPATRLLFVDSGVEAENKQKAHDEILRQLDALAAGDFTDEELADTKLLVKNSLMATTDSLAALEGWYLSQLLRGRDISPEQDARELDSITRDEIVRAARSVRLDTVYFLTGKEAQA